MSGSGREAIPDVRHGSEGHPGCSGLVGRPSRIYGSDRKAFPDVREWLGRNPGCLGVVWVSLGFAGVV